jgi:hypothetical protein
MDSSLLEQFLGLSSTHFQLPPLIEEENDELHPLINIESCRLNQTNKLLLGIDKLYIDIDKVYLFPHT